MKKSANNCVHLKLFLFGVSGAGKTEVMKRIFLSRLGVSCHKKDTTRDRRAEEKGKDVIDLNFLSDEKAGQKGRLKLFQKNKSQGKYDVVYFKNDTWYGVNHDQILNSVDRSEIHLTILGSINGIRDIKRMYGDAIAIYFHTDPVLVNKNLEERAGQTLEERKKRIARDYQMYLQNNTLFDHVILNFWELDNAILQFNKILDFHIKERMDLYRYGAEY